MGADRDDSRNNDILYKSEEESESENKEEVEKEEVEKEEDTEEDCVTIIGAQCAIINSQNKLIEELQNKIKEQENKQIDDDLKEYEDVKKQLIEYYSDRYDARNSHRCSECKEKLICCRHCETNCGYSYGNNQPKPTTFFVIEHIKRDNISEALRNIKNDWQNLRSYNENIGGSNVPYSSFTQTAVGIYLNVTQCGPGDNIQMFLLQLAKYFSTLDRYIKLSNKIHGTNISL